MGSKNKGLKTKNKEKNKNKPNSTLSTQYSNTNKNEKSSSKIITDARFASLHSDPRFQKVPRHKTKVVIDSRFNRMFNDKKFAPSSAPMDKRGKPKKGKAQSSLRHYYHLEDDDEEEEKRKKDVVSEGGDSEEFDEESESSEMLESEKEEEKGSESGSTTDEEDVDIVYEDGEPEIQEENVPMIEKETRRLAVVNMDWRHVKAPADYEGLNFHTQALQQSKIHLSWDEDEPQRGKILKRKFNAEQLAELELKEFLASDESESDDDENEDTAKDQSDKKNKKRDIYRALLQSGDGSDEDGEDDGQDMEVTFNTGLEDISKRILEKKDKEAETVWEAHLRKRQEKRKAKKNKSKYSSEDESYESDKEATEPDDFFVEEPFKSKKKRKQLENVEKEANATRAELELLLTDDKGADTDLKGYNLKPKKAKGKTRKEVLDEEKLPVVDDDPRFSSLFTSPLYALDPTDPQFKRSATYARQIAKKLQKGEQQELAVEDKKMPKNAQFPSGDPGMNKVEHEKSDILSSKEKHALSSMVRSVKMKLKQVQLPSDLKMSKKSLSGMGRKKEQHPVHSMKKFKDLRK
ncbi:ESF1 homolog isoform X2 [Durio zibethinus]|uniref:ESF1 homolog isoform X2 n=1 Tax=Durio zibethinus TaxID=66656 RepID=A0A6P5YHC0_DURZI|nr:ESF1 homolog isoform X2 [Durio zibethinus]